jgi:3-phosphoshikimate 1-carboxyvinyltransferase
MAYRISLPAGKLQGTIELTASKSESNRVLVIQALCKDPFLINNLATAQDTVVLKEVLEELKKQDVAEHSFDIGMAGTAMRFLTAYLSTKPGTYTLTGSARMKKRPIGILVDALRHFGADIEYLEEEGFAPIRIKGTKLKGGEVEVDGGISSQFVSALLLISTELRYGLVIKFKGEVTSRPYINMTLKMLEEFRVYGQWQENSISVSPQTYHVKSEENYAYQVEADWSAASYYYAMAALAVDADLSIKGLKHPSLQGDSIVSDIFTFFGVKTEYIENGIRLTKCRVKDEHFGYDFSDCPDLAQTVAVTASALGIPVFLNGLHTLRIKETDRIEALKTELKKIGTKAEIKGNTLTLDRGETVGKPAFISTYEDHRMAMSFATLGVRPEGITISNPEVVKKSYPSFWDDLRKLGFKIEEV